MSRPVVTTVPDLIRGLSLLGGGRAEERWRLVGMSILGAMRCFHSTKEASTRSGYDVLEAFHRQVLGLSGRSPSRTVGACGQHGPRPPAPRRTHCGGATPYDFGVSGAINCQTKPSQSVPLGRSRALVLCSDRPGLDPGPRSTMCSITSRSRVKPGTVGGRQPRSAMPKNRTPIHQVPGGVSS